MVKLSEKDERKLSELWLEGGILALLSLSLIQRNIEIFQELAVDLTLSKRLQQIKAVIQPDSILLS